MSQLCHKVQVTYMVQTLKTNASESIHLIMVNPQGSSEFEDGEKKMVNNSRFSDIISCGAWDAIVQLLTNQRKRLDNQAHVGDDYNQS